MPSAEAGGAGVSASIRSQQDLPPSWDNNTGGEGVTVFLVNMQTGASHINIHDLNIIPTRDT